MLLGVYDGHQGSTCSETLAKTFHAKLMPKLSEAGASAAPSSEGHTEVVHKILNDAFEDWDTDFLQRYRTMADGTTAVVGLLLGTTLHVANAGDSAAFLCNAGRARMLHKNHKPDEEEEKKRVEEAGGQIVEVGCARVTTKGYEDRMREYRMALASGMGTMMREPVALAVSRALGDRDFKIPDKIVVATPFVASYELVESDTHFVLCCDGLTDVMAPQEIIDMTKKAENPKSASATIVQEAFQRGSEDNLTAVVAMLEWPAERAERIKKLKVEKVKLSQILFKHAECMVPLDRVRGVKVTRSKDEAVKMAADLKKELEKLKEFSAFADAAK